MAITPNEATRLVAAGGNVTIDVAAGTVDVPSQLSYRSLADAETPMLPQQYRVTGKAFDLTAEAALLKPITITVGISAADTVLAEGKEANIVMQHYRQGAWTQVPTTVDFAASTAVALVRSLSFFALTIKLGGDYPDSVWASPNPCGSLHPDFIGDSPDANGHLDPADIYSYAITHAGAYPLGYCDAATDAHANALACSYVFTHAYDCAHC